MLGQLGMHPDHLIHRVRVHEERDPGRRASPTRPAPAGSATDPATSVLDADCRAHELDNLYVVDTSFFPSIGAVNPALTAMANALRVGDHLLERPGATTPAGRSRSGSGRRAGGSIGAVRIPQPDPASARGQTPFADCHR